MQSLHYLCPCTSSWCDSAPPSLYINVQQLLRRNVFVSYNLKTHTSPTNPIQICVECTKSQAHREHLVVAPKVVAYRMDPRSIAASPCHGRNRAGECLSRCATRGACLCVTALEHDMCARLFWLMWIKRCVDACIWWALFISPTLPKSATIK